MTQCDWPSAEAWQSSTTWHVFKNAKAYLVLSTRFACQNLNFVCCAAPCREVFDDVEVRALGNGLAGRIVWIEVRLRPVRAVQRLGKDACRGGLAGTARAHEQVGVRDAVASDRVLQRAHHVILADDVVKRLGPPLACDDLVTGRSHGCR